ncbi:MAG TPA: hypothetical protein VKB65_04065, partial [Myxococcota bacterium]|nr:hypothetical protein [Myxococcota bacterium]
ELRREATREAVERRRDLLASLVVPDEPKVSVLVVGEPGREATERTLASLRAQTIGRAALDVHVVPERSAGLALAVGRYVAHLEAGDELWPDHLAVLCDHLDRTGRAMTFSRALQPGPRRPHATDGAPVLPRQASRSEFAPAAAVVHRRRALLDVGGFDPDLGRGQAWDLWSRFVERLRADAVPVLSARVGGDDAAPERRFDLLLVKLGNLARARRHGAKARRHLERGDVRLAAQVFGRAFNLGLPIEEFVPAIAAVAGRSRSLAADLVALGGAEVEPHVRGPFQRIARGAEARRTMALRTHRHALRGLYREAEARGRARARRFGWRDDPAG